MKNERVNGVLLRESFWSIDVSSPPIFSRFLAPLAPLGTSCASPCAVAPLRVSSAGTGFRAQMHTGPYSVDL